ncbi:GTPase activating protein [Coprinopsis cinerea okayama7|uniref:GTPase activating protein n=1 Tax=Coprinopsis cinerea (strain Okayama-7 / 130 / ATCC MYA-4618 / FGSC 9003) TaxID=240176 RepID=A8N1G8_COPC7|nr:GTPase activating protein [Coprinopsis cinerea okayama7\|eukprot:XP_001828717.2 GTPase activating protein [Coprinopsis cinerea okayama7\
MSDTWDRLSSQREYLVSVELYVSTTAGSALRKPVSSRRKAEKRDSSAVVLDDNKLRDRASWQALPKSLSGAGQWRNATCKLSEEGDRCFLNIYVDESILYQTVYIHLLNQTDIRPADPSLFFRKDCIGLYCIEGQRWTSATTAEPIYLQFPNPDTCATWLALLKSYAIPEIYGRWFFPVDGGSYRMWRQIELSVIQARHIRAQKAENGYDIGDAGGDAEFDGEVSCEIHLNSILCGRTTGKKRPAGNSLLDWHEKFVFPDLPPFETLVINIWREKKATKPTVLGLVRIELFNFRRGETTEGWFPIIQGMSGSSRETQIGELRLKLRVDEEIILPQAAYQGLLATFDSRNFLDWMTELESKLKLKHISSQLMAVAIAQDTLIVQVQEFAAREVLGAPISHQTLFRGNTVFTKVMELAMTWYGKAFLEASIGQVLRRLCAEKVAIEVDPVKSGKSNKEVEKNVEQLIYWCQEFWNQIYAVRNECPIELRRLFLTIRKLVEERCRNENGSIGANRDLPKQSVSAFVFLRFIVPAILHPHLFGLCPGLPSDPVKRSLTLIAKVIQSLANLNASAQKEAFMRGIKDFLANSLSAMVDYIAAVSGPIDEHQANHSNREHRHGRLRIANGLRERRATMAVLDREAIPTLPHLLDVPRHLAVITSAVIRSCRDPSIHPGLSGDDSVQLEEFCTRCAEVEEQALFRVTQLASKLSIRRPSLPNVHSPNSALPGLTSPVQTQPSKPRYNHRQTKSAARPSTAPSSGSNTPRQGWNEIPPPNSPVARSKHGDSNGTNDVRERLPSQPGTNRPRHVKVPSSDAVPLYTVSTVTTGRPAISTPQRVPSASNETPEDITKRKRGLFRGILKR